MADSRALELLLDHAQDKVVLLDEKARITYANEAVRRILGYDPDDLIESIAFEYVHRDDVAELEARFDELLDADAFAQCTATYRFRADDGSWVWLESRMSNLTDEGLEGYVVSSRDVTDRVAAERDRQETATRLRELASATGDVLWMFSADWSELLFMNPAYETVYGGSLEDIKENPSTFIELIHPDDVSRVEDAMACLSAGEPMEMEYRVNPDEEYGVWVWVKAEPIIEDGEVVRITGFSRDVTDRRRREQQLYVMDNLLRHNLRNDLTLILGNASLIAEENPGAAERISVIRQTGEDLLESAEKEREIIDLLTSEVSLKEFDLTETVTRTARVVSERFPAAHVECEHLEAVQVSAVSDLQLALVELLENAIRHSESAEPSLRVTAERRGDDVVVTVEDDAPTIPEIESNVLSGNYEMNEVYHSSGLGLWLVYWVVELSGGEIDVQSTTGVGNRVEVTLQSWSE